MIGGATSLHSVVSYKFEAEPLFPCPDVGDPISGTFTSDKDTRSALRQQLVDKYRLTHPLAEMVASSSSSAWKEFPEAFVKARVTVVRTRAKASAKR